MLAQSKPWEPNPENVKKIKNEITEEYAKYGKKIPPAGVEEGVWIKILDVWAKMGAFLMDINATVKQLKKINGYLCGHAIPELPELNVIALPSEGKKGRVHVLRQLLEKGLATIGFKAKFAKTLGFVGSDMFRKTLRDGWMLKDAAFRNTEQKHGEFPHVEQIFMVMLQQKESKFLGDDDKIITEAIKAMGEDWAIIKDVNLQGADGKTVWDIIFDQPPLAKISDSDFRKPDNLTACLLGEYSIHLGKTTAEDKKVLISVSAECASLQSVTLERHLKQASPKVNDNGKRGISYTGKTKDEKIVMPEDEVTNKQDIKSGGLTK